MQILNVLVLSTIALSTLSTCAPAPPGGKDAVALDDKKPHGHHPHCHCEHAPGAKGPVANKEEGKTEASTQSEGELGKRDLDNSWGSFVVARVWTRQQERALQDARRRYETESAKRGTAHFNQQAFLAAQQAYNNLQREKTDEESTVNREGSPQAGHHHRRDLDDGFSSLVARVWTRQQERALQDARRRYETESAKRGTAHFNQQAFLAAQQAYNNLQREKTDEESTVNREGSPQAGHHHRRDLDDGLSSLVAREPWTRAKEAALQAARHRYETESAHRGTPQFNQQAYLHAQNEYNTLQREKTDNGSHVHE